jgi:hypothetical protein
MKVMFGAYYPKNYVNEYLQQDIPVRIVSYRNEWGLDDIQLPSPVSYFVYEPIALDSWPTIINVVMSTNSITRIGYDSSNPLYRVSYAMRTYVWVKTEQSEPATSMRDRLTTVVRSALLDYPCLNAVDPNNYFKVEIDESTMQEQFSDLTLLKGDRVLAGAYLSYTLNMDEVIERPDRGVFTEKELIYEHLSFLPD